MIRPLGLKVYMDDLMANILLLDCHSTVLRRRTNPTCWDSKVPTPAWVTTHRSGANTEIWHLILAMVDFACAGYADYVARDSRNDPGLPQAIQSKRSGWKATNWIMH